MGLFKKSLDNLLCGCQCVCVGKVKVINGLFLDHQKYFNVKKPMHYFVCIVSGSNDGRFNINSANVKKLSRRLVERNRFK